MKLYIGTREITSKQILQDLYYAFYQPSFYQNWSCCMGGGGRRPKVTPQREKIGRVIDVFLRN